MADYDQDKEPPKPRSEPEEALIAYDEDSLNLVPVFCETEEGKKYLRRISRKVRSDFDTDYDGASGYREAQADDWAIFSGDLPDKEPPFEDCSNPSLPLYLENITRLCFRITGELFGDWSNVATAVPMGPDNQSLADLVTRHTNWQISEQIPDFRRQIGHRGVLVYLAHGDLVCHSYFDVESKRNKHEILTCDSFVKPFMHTTVMPDLSDCPHYTKIWRIYRHELEARENDFYDVRKVLDKTSPSWNDEPEGALSLAVSSTLGVDAGDDATEGKTLGGEGAPFILLWYEGWLRLPNQEKDRWCQVIQDSATGCIMRLTIHERANWQDKARYDMQLQERDSFIQAQAAHQEAVTQIGALQSHVDEQIGQAADAVAHGLADPSRASLAANHLQTTVPNAPPPPMPPEWMTDKLAPSVDKKDQPVPPPNPAEVEPEPPMREPVYLFQQAVCIEPLVGNLGISLGRIQANFNRAANTALSQVTDAATMNNIFSIITTGLEFEEGRLDLTPGAINKVTGAVGSSLRDHIFPLQPGQPSGTLMEVVKLSSEKAQSSIQSPDVLSGESGKSGETAKGIMARIEQATKQLSVLSQKYAEFVRNVLINNAYLNSIFMREEEPMLLFNSESDQYEEVKMGRRIYERSYRFIMKSDMRFTTNVQKIQEADELVAMWTKIPHLAQNPVFGHEVIKQALLARGKKDLVRLMGEPPMDPATGAPIKPVFMPPPPPPPPGGPPGPPNGAPRPAGPPHPPVGNA